MFRRLGRLHWLCVLVLVWAAGSCLSAAAEPSAKPLVLLVPGMIQDLGRSSEVWGRRETDDSGRTAWTGMVGALERAGWRFGGQVRVGRAALQLPRDLDLEGVAGEAQTADCFWLQYSESAATDGIALKAMELATTIRRVREFTGRTHVYLVAHSAGGLVARAYLQSAFPDALPFRHDVDRLITVSSPHLGSAVAEHWGDWLGTRATSLKTTASLLSELNEELELPHDVCFASIVVRGIWTDVAGDGPDYDGAIDREFIDALPADFREGGDQVLSVRTQNLRLARCAAHYEEATGRAVQYVVARVRRDSAEMIHTSALSDPQVQHWVGAFLTEDDRCWRGFDSASDRARWVDRQAAGCAFALVEQQTRSNHWYGGVECGRLRVSRRTPEQDQLAYGFSGETTWRRRMIGVFSSSVPVSGSMLLSTDRFGRVRGCRWEESDGAAESSELVEVAAGEF